MIEQQTTTVGTTETLCVHEFHGAPWGIYCRHCGVMYFAQDQDPPSGSGDWETKDDDDEPTHYLDGSKI
jgi:hypothetical protein